MAFHGVEQNPAVSTLEIPWKELLFLEIFNAGIFLKGAYPENDSLIARFCIEEFKRAVFEMNPDKAPRLEGMNVAFCQRCWPTIGSDVFSQCCAWEWADSQTVFAAIGGTNGGAAADDRCWTTPTVGWIKCIVMLLSLKNGERQAGRLSLGMPRGFIELLNKTS
ncbi:hypothetical protein PVK06_014284 [Gossypium arboreum]|uniref:Uncharacterized protein n=1 Tax=Gossypium arboreum TaxID=29729 RepID=A0ABR0PUI0_GOSAR|nr:hypothetical protein PVK06_014284 [Gossypium arboreum]